MIVVDGVNLNAVKEVEDICNILGLPYLSYSADDYLYRYEINNLEENRLVPFMIRFLHLVSYYDYDFIKIY